MKKFSKKQWAIILFVSLVGVVLLFKSSGFLFIFLPIAYVIYYWSRLRKNPAVAKGSPVRNSLRYVIISFFITPVFFLITVIVGLSSGGIDRMSEFNQIFLAGALFGIYPVAIISLIAFFSTFPAHRRAMEITPTYSEDKKWMYGTIPAFIIQLLLCFITAYLVSYGLS
ncbi:MAG: hypothetical protein WCT27_02470 [Patescibacteria group bacterium]|jgi:hypothetical protein